MTKSSPQDVIESYKKRQKVMPYVVGGLAVLLVVVGIVILLLALSGGRLFAPPTATSTPTQTATATLPPTATPLPATATFTPSPSLSPTATLTPTPSGPFEYTVLENDNCWDIAVKFKVELTVLLAINNFAPGTCPIVPGQKIMIPTSDQTLPTPTLVDITKLTPGYLVEYYVQPNDTLRAIALLFYSTEDAIIKQNKIVDRNLIMVGDKLLIPVNIATPVPTLVPTSTSAATSTPAPATATLTPTK